MDLLLDPSISYSDLKNTIQLSSGKELLKILVKDEEGDLITVTSELELQEVYRFGFNQEKLEITALCTPTRPLCCPSQTCPKKSLIEGQQSVCDAEKEKEKEKEKVKEKEKEKEKQPSFVHRATCDSCNKNIVGIRYKCSVCPDYDLCSVCEELNTQKETHPQNHYFLKINKPISGCPFRRYPFNRSLPQQRCPFSQPKVVAPSPPVQSTKGLEERVSSAESRIEELEQKLKDMTCSRMKGKKLHVSKTCEDKTSPQPIPKKKLVKIVTMPPVSPPEKILPQQTPLFNFELPKFQQEVKKETPSEAVVFKKEEEVVAQIEPEVKAVVEPAKEEPKTEKVDSPLVAQLVAMGFDRQIVLNITEIYSDIESALEHLLF